MFGKAKDWLRNGYRRVRRLGGRVKRKLLPPGRGPYLMSERRRPTLEIHIPISPTPIFFNMVRCLTHSLRRNGGAYRDAPIIVTAGDRDVDPGLAHRLGWDGRDGIELRWAAPADFAAMDIRAQGRQRLRYEYKSDVVLLQDADTLVAGPLDELVEAVFAEQVIAGVIAHVYPFHRAGLPDVTWQRLFRECGVAAPRLAYEHTGWGYMCDNPDFRYCPAYFNYGVVAAPASFMRRIGSVIDDTTDRVRRVAASFFDAQLSLAVAIGRLGLPARALPMRWNFANDWRIEALHAAELPHARILHLLGRDRITKEQIYPTLESLEQFAAAPWPRVITAQAQRVIRDILPQLRSEARQSQAA